MEQLFPEIKPNQNKNLDNLAVAIKGKLEILKKECEKSEKKDEITMKLIDFSIKALIKRPINLEFLE
jgi:hypothetical protein